MEGMPFAPIESRDAIVVGAGIAGLAHAYHLARRGLSVAVLERSPRAAGASIRNFGMIWPIGQRAGEPLDTAHRSVEIWREVLLEARIPYFPSGSLHAAHREDEETVACEFAALAPGLGYRVQWIGRGEVLERCPAVNPKGLRGGLWSPVEMVVDPRETIARLPEFLAARYGVEFVFSSPALEIADHKIRTPRTVWTAERIFVCSGHEFETLFPDAFAASGIVPCKLQMMRTEPQPPGFHLGPALAGGLTLRFYPAFAICPSLPKLASRIAHETPELDRWGIHILVSQTLQGELTLGDSHEYGEAIRIFDRAEIDSLILRETDKLLSPPSRRITERWHGIYGKHPAQPWWIENLAPGVRIVTGLGGSGMTQSFGLAERTTAI